ncbi:MAG: RnfABCDGE type electron transport complex subunit D [Candidatus Omnitrophica bacterium]|nr:RnfABCDGE type electron transport complex subunit D [Candidatus Omnitrophota bacterium]
MQNKLSLSISPHIRKKESITRIMWTVFLCLLPSGIAGIFIFGIRSLWIIFACISTAMLTEALILFLRHKKLAIADGSAALTGLLLAYNLPSTFPVWMACVGSFFAIAVCKQAFGGLGRNIFNPALAGRAFLVIAWPKYMVSFSKPFIYVDSITAATPLNLLKQGRIESIQQAGLDYFDMFLGNRGGCIGEVCIACLILGAIFLLWRRIISWHIPASFITTLALLTFFLGGPQPGRADVLFSIMAGGVVLGAFFMATDYVTSALTDKGKLIFGFGCGLLTFIIRKWGGYPEGVSFAILIMNATVPLLDRFCSPRIYGYEKNT